MLHDTSSLVSSEALVNSEVPPSTPPPARRQAGLRGRWLKFWALSVLVISLATLLLVLVMTCGDILDDSTGLKGPGPATAYIVETLPVTDFDLPLVPGSKNTYEALIGLVNGTQRSLDVTTMYWNLLASEDDDYPGLGSERGAQLYSALEDAASRGVSIRFLQVCGGVGCAMCACPRAWSSDTHTPSRTS